jgi:hypothetical protein
MDALCELLDGLLNGHLVLLFTEFRETASALWARLRSRGGVARIDGSSAWLGAGRASRLEVVRRFAPRSNGAHPPPMREQVRLLIATDVLAEGLNLQDADTVISYDLPWNPVRLIQRVGRIDRLGSQHDLVGCYNFMPDRHLEDYIALVRRLSTKLEVIRGGLGEEEVVLATADTAFLDRLVRGDPTVLEESTEPPDVWSELRPAARVGGVLQLDGLPVAELPGAQDAVVFALGGPPVRFVRIQQGQVRTLVGLEASQLVRTALNVTDGQSDASAQQVEDALAALDRQFNQSAALQASSAAGQVGRRVLQLVRVCPDSEVVTRRADALLRRLAQGLRTGEEASASAWASRSHGRTSGCVEVTAMLEDLERCLGLATEPKALSNSVLAAFVIRATP